MIDLSDEPLPSLPERSSTAHKGVFGRGVIVGGSLGMAGAPALSAMACLRSGAGLVSVATPRCVLQTVASYHPAYTTTPLPCDGERITEHASRVVLENLASVDAAAIGPGMGPSPALLDLVSKASHECQTPLVFDADGLNALAKTKEALSRAAGPRVLTPHAGEYARLAGTPLTDANDPVERREAAASLARLDPSGKTVVVLKGHRTVVTDGRRFAENPTGNPGMATGGSGDVLTGVILALLCQGLEGFDAGRLGVYVHGLAGDLAAEKLGELSMTAVDLCDALPYAWQQVSTPPLP